MLAIGETIVYKNSRLMASIFSNGVSTVVVKASSTGPPDCVSMEMVGYMLPIVIMIECRYSMLRVRILMN